MNSGDCAQDISLSVRLVCALFLPDGGQLWRYYSLEEASRPIREDLLCTDTCMHILAVVQPSSPQSTPAHDAMSMFFS
ncbi:hypothetical protein IF2G_07040 [Cordyceps javanica]|nr:hypothetical protein IF2G_07040 [Cordyceps javanica]